MNKKQRVEKLKADVFSDDWETAKSACRRLFRFGGRFHKTARRRHRRFLLAVLDRDHVRARNAAAVTFRAHCYHPAVAPLLRALQNPANNRTRGTLAYALEKLRCSRRLSELFAIVFGAPDNYEVLMHVLTVLDEQVFEFTREDLHRIARRWGEVKPTWSGMAFDQEVIQDFVDGYLAYVAPPPARLLS